MSETTILLFTAAMLLLLIIYVVYRITSKSTEKDRLFEKHEKTFYPGMSAGDGFVPDSGDKAGWVFTILVVLGISWIVIYAILVSLGFQMAEGYLLVSGILFFVAGITQAARVSGKKTL